MTLQIRSRIDYLVATYNIGVVLLLHYFDVKFPILSTVS